MPGVRENTDRSTGNRYNPPTTAPPANGSSLRPALPRMPVTPPPPVPVQTPPKVKLEQIVALPAPALKDQLAGQNNTAAASVRLTLAATDSDWRPAAGSR
jgi:hypothetical protein